MTEPTIFSVPEAWRSKSFFNREKYQEAYARSVKDPVGFWADEGRRLDWIRPFTQVKDVDYTGEVRIRWYYDGSLNVSANCIDRHLPKRAKPKAIIWEGDDPKDSRHITYAELHEQVCRMANVLKEMGAKRGDRITIYMPMIPEAA